MITSKIARPANFAGGHLGDDAKFLGDDANFSVLFFGFQKCECVVVYFIFLIVLFRPWRGWIAFARVEFMNLNYGAFT